MGFCGSRAGTSTSPYLAAGGWGEQGQLRGHSVPDWRQIRSPPLLRNAARGGEQVLEGGLQPVSPSKKNTSPAHQGKGAEAAPAQQDLWAPAGWKKSSEHFSKSSLCQKLQSDRCKSQPEPQLLPLLSQPQASEVTLAPQAVGMAVGSVQVAAPLAPPWTCFCNRTSRWGLAGGNITLNA